MNFSNNTSNDSVLLELGQRIARYRLNRNMSQDVLAREAGVSKRTIQRIEHGFSIQTSNLVRILRVFELLENLEALIPGPALSPIQQIKMRGKTRQRASSNSPVPEGKTPWTWEDEE